MNIREKFQILCFRSLENGLCTVTQRKSCSLGTWAAVKLKSGIARVRMNMQTMGLATRAASALSAQGRVESVPEPKAGGRARGALGSVAEAPPPVSLTLQHLDCSTLLHSV